MKIKDLPYPIKEFCLFLQEECDSRRNENVDIREARVHGGFYWTFSTYPKNSIVKNFTFTHDFWDTIDKRGEILKEEYNYLLHEIELYLPELVQKKQIKIKLNNKLWQKEQ